MLQPLLAQIPTTAPAGPCDFCGGPSFATFLGEIIQLVVLFGLLFVLIYTCHRFYRWKRKQRINPAARTEARPKDAAER